MTYKKRRNRKSDVSAVEVILGIVLVIAYTVILAWGLNLLLKAIE